jgi:hypothetical protein
METLEEKAGLAKKAAKASILGTAAHSVLCPVHGLPALLLKTGAITGPVIAPLYAANEYLEGKLASGMNYFIYDIETATHTAHHTMDYAGWAAVIGIPGYMIGKYIYKKMKKSHIHI